MSMLATRVEAAERRVELQTLRRLSAEIMGMPEHISDRKKERVIETCGVGCAWGRMYAVEGSPDIRAEVWCGASGKDPSDVGIPDDHIFVTRSFQTPIWDESGDGAINEARGWMHEWTRRIGKAAGDDL